MTDKEKIIDILLEFYEEYQGNILNRPMIPSLYASKIIDSLQEEPEFSKEEQIIHDGYLNKIRKKRVIPELRGEVKHKFINEFNTMYQTLQMGMFERCMRDPMMEVCLDFAAWGAFHLKGYYGISDEEKVKMDSMQEEPVSEDLEKAANEWDAKASFTPFYMTLDDKGNPNGVRQDYTTHAESFKAGANWEREQIAKENMLLPFKEYDNLMESINKRKKEGYEAGYIASQQGEKELIDKAVGWIGEIYNYHEIMRYSDSCEPPLSELTEWFKNYMKEENINSK